MGFRVSYAVFDGELHAHVLAELGLIGSSHQSQHPESDWALCQLPDGRIVVWNEDPNGPLTDLEMWERLTESRGEALVVSVNETDMTSRAAGISFGWTDWEVKHDFRRGLEHLEVSGGAPARLETLVAEAKKKAVDEADHMFDVPVRLVEETTTFRYDHDAPAPFQVLQKAWSFASIAVSSEQTVALLDLLFLERTPNEVRYAEQADWTLAELPNGLTVVTSSFRGSSLWSHDLRELSADGSVWLLRTDENFGYACVSRFCDGRTAAFAEYGSRSNRTSLNSEGELPGLEEFIERAEGPSMLYVPIQVFQSATGWEPTSSEGLRLEELRPRTVKVRIVD